MMRMRRMVLKKRKKQEKEKERKEEKEYYYLKLLMCISQGSHNRIPQPAWLKTTGIYCLTGLEARSWKSKC